MKRIYIIPVLFILIFFIASCSNISLKTIPKSDFSSQSDKSTIKEEADQTNANAAGTMIDNSQKGNTNGNIMNEGYYAEAGEWIYAGLKDGLYKYGMDGTGYLKVCDDNAKYINAAGDWIYYVNTSDRTLNKIKKDGTGKVKFDDGIVAAVMVSDDWIYYCQSPTGANFQLYKMKTDGSGKVKLCEDKVGDVDEAYINLYGDLIYYWSGNDSIFSSIKTDGTGKKQYKRIYCAVIDGDWIYYANGSDGRKLYKIRPDGSENIKISDDEIPLPINVYNGWIYYFKETGDNRCKLYKIKLDGTERTELCDDKFSIYFGRRHGVIVNIVGNWVYINRYIADNALQRIKVGMDSTGKQVISTDEIPAIYKRVDESQRAALEKIAKQIIVDKLERNKDADVPEEERIKDFKIEEIRALNGDISNFGFSVEYSVQSEDGNIIWLAGNGEPGENGWVLGKLQFYTVKKEGSSYEIESYGTSPTFPMIEAENNIE
ncbi:hypothetical protein OXPF_27210 [Oxobacter pfennigii]|uniref:Prolow-density lipoprotein receptor-related protein 1-like beta-propeller domain-containing protein n=1 Tax=Oxobacter pfennigii TaxID=36849 RepID=A0A0N8NSX9_9CLOT|nr:DUF5050 domain-containing protein [Oxobacter pfennigii]KPU43280.1 hypothetical protein OXPF_27210 [Oxobacter pfennigii]